MSNKHPCDHEDYCNATPCSLRIFSALAGARVQLSQPPPLLAVCCFLSAYSSAQKRYQKYTSHLGKHLNPPCW